MLAGAVHRPESNGLALRDTRALSLLGVLPGLGDALDPQTFAAARDEVIVTTALFETRGRDASWGSESGPIDTSVLIVEGLLLRRLSLDGRCCSELLGPGDFVRPWDDEAIVGLPKPASVRWRVIEGCRVAFVDARLIQRAARYPELVGMLLTRSVRRSQSLAVHLTISSMPRVEDRLWLLFWHLAERWGTVTPAGVRLDLPVTHELLAELVGAQRPTTTSALVGLSRDRRVIRDGDGSWLLQRPDDLVEALAPAA